MSTFVFNDSVLLFFFSENLYYIFIVVVFHYYLFFSSFIILDSFRFLPSCNDKLLSNFVLNDSILFLIVNRLLYFLFTISLCTIIFYIIDLFSLHNNIFITLLVPSFFSSVVFHVKNYSCKVDVNIFVFLSDLNNIKKCSFIKIFGVLCLESVYDHQDFY